MNRITASVIAFVVLAICSCQIPQITRPLRLYDVGNGKTIEVFLLRSSQNNGKLVSVRVDSERFEGEMIFYGSGDPYYLRRDGLPQAQHQSQVLSDDASFAEFYGYGKDARAQPVATAILVGAKGTTIEIVLYRMTSDLYGDGVAKDNKGRRYRVFLSVEG